MKKLIIIIIGAFTILFGVNVKGSTFYTLDTPIVELNNHSLRQVFENRNIASPTLTGKEHLGNGVYRLYNANSITLDYDIYSGIYSMIGTPTANVFEILIYNLIGGETYTLSAYKVSGTTNQVRFSWAPLNDIRVIFPTQTQETKTLSTYKPQIYASDATYYDIQFKLQLEKGSTATPYQVATNGPYNDFDVSTLGLTSQQMDYWFNVYQDLLKDIDRVSQLPNLFIDLFNELTDNFVIGIKGFTELIYLPGYGLTDLGIISLIVVAISVIGISIYIIRKVIK